MKVYQNIKECIKPKDCYRVLTIGMYDGVHLGHQKILNTLAADALEKNGESVLLTFTPHPRQVLQGMDTVQLLNTPKEKIERLKKTQINSVIFHPFTKEFSRLTATDFIRDLLVNQLQVDKLVIGYDHHFGRNREGNYENLVELSELYNFEIDRIPKISLEHIAISSTKVRAALENGDLKLAHNYLGDFYSVTGTVISGKKIGKKIGFPTANLKIPSYKKLPKNGVYIAEVLLKSTPYNAVANIGTNPTFEQKGTFIEIHILDFNQDIYNQEITVSFKEHIRSEIKFSNQEALRNQIAKDVNYAHNYFK